MFSPLLTNIKSKPMMQTKIAWLLLDFFGLSVTFIGVVKNLDNVYSPILIILSSVYLALRIYYYRRQKEQSIRKEELELWNLEQNKQERIENQESLKKFRRLEKDEYGDQP